MFGPPKSARNLEALKEFATADGDRSQPPYFAGREQILCDIENACEEIWRRHRLPGQKNLSGRTRLIYGAPGAGKSSTLLHLRDEWFKGRYATRRSDSSKRSLPTPVMIYSGDGNIFDNLKKLCVNVVKAAAPKSRSRLFAKVSKTQRIFGGANFGVGGGFGHDQTTELYVASAGLDVVANALPRRKWTRPVVIAVDEAQTMTGDRNSSVAKMLKALHANDFNLPVVVVLAGLSDTKQRVTELGLSRLSNKCTHSLDCLNEAELEDLKQGFCDHFEIELGAHASQFNALLEHTEGWPCHIQNALQAFGEVYIEAECDMNAVDFSKVEELSRASQLRYYRSRRSNVMKETALLLGNIMQEVTGQQKIHQVIRIINSVAKQFQKMYEGLDGSGGLPSGMTANDFCYHLIHRGALQERDDDTVACPIPSFRQFLIDEMLEDEEYMLQRDVPLYRVLPGEVLSGDFLGKDKRYLH